MDLTHLQALRPTAALAVTAGLLCPAAVRAAVPSGATASPAALRRAYIDAVKAHSPAALEALFDLSAMPPTTRAAFRKHVCADFDHPIRAVTLGNPAPTLQSDYARRRAYFPQPVVKVLKVSFVGGLGQSESSEYYLGSSAGRYYFVIAFQATK